MGAEGERWLESGRNRERRSESEGVIHTERK